MLHIKKSAKIAGVKPTFEKLKGQDPLAYIISANLARRNLTKGQQAMALAMVYPDPEKGGRGENSLLSKGFSLARLSQARTVLRYSRKLAEGKLDGDWLPWLKDNFGWSVQTAQKYMSVAKALEMPSGAVFDSGINIDANALYLISAPVDNLLCSG